MPIPNELSWEETEVVDECDVRSTQVRALIVALLRQFPTLDRKQLVKDLNEVRASLRANNR